MNNQITDINLGYLLELYDRYLADPGSVDAATRLFFIVGHIFHFLIFCSLSFSKTFCNGSS